jgi:ABC-type xylose transport system permease subunit
MNYLKRFKATANMGFATSRAGQSGLRLQIIVLLRFWQEGTLIRLKILTSTAKLASSAAPAGRNAKSCLRQAQVVGGNVWQKLNVLIFSAL